MEQFKLQGKNVKKQEYTQGVTHDKGASNTHRELAFEKGEYEGFTNAHFAQMLTKSQEAFEALSTKIKKDTTIRHVSDPTGEHVLYVVPIDTLKAATANTDVGVKKEMINLATGVTVSQFNTYATPTRMYEQLSKKTEKQPEIEKKHKTYQKRVTEFCLGTLELLAEFGDQVDIKLLERFRATYQGLHLQLEI